uniref:Partial AB-hydrolase lipase domain-containing protein n=1 Tax=Calidris pygmaea TaxID=425635 RepID=A0A8C3PTG8_9CHAR
CSWLPEWTTCILSGLQAPCWLSLGFPQSEIIRYHGYPSEEYEVTTKDGYILGVFRIPAGRNSRNTGKKPAVLLHHGTLGDCIHWISNLPNNSLGFLLADAGYDVWMGNSRGNTWSLKHKTLKPSQKEFWQFSFDEIGKYDILAELCFIMNKTGQKDVYYIGTSEAAAAGFIALYTYPELARRVKVFFALGPVTTITHATSPLVTFARLPKLLIRVPHSFILSQPWVTAFITLLLSLQSRIDTYVAHFPAGAAVQNVIHWHQNPFSKHNFWFNHLHSGLPPFLQSAPPVYPIEKISTPVAVWSGGRDKFADPKDMAKLLPQISNLIYHEHFPSWGHLDFVWGLDATEKMYLKIIELMAKHP